MTISTSESNQQYSLTIQGMRCAGCVKGVKKALDNAPGVVIAEVNFANQTAQVTTKGTSDDLIQAIEQAGYHGTIIYDAERSEQERSVRQQAEYRHKRRSAVYGIGLGIPLMLYGVVGGDMSVHSLSDQAIWGGVGLLTLWIMIQAGKHFFKGALKSLSNGQTNMDTLIALGTGSAWLYSMLVVLVPNWFPDNTRHLYFEASVMIIGLINLGQALELRARQKTSQALRRLLDLRPKTATCVDGERVYELPVEQIKVNQIIRLRSGEKIPVDGQVIEGQSTVNEAMLTGEAMPVKKSIGDKVSAGTINGQGSVLFKATRVGSDTLLAQIINQVAQAQNSKPPISMLADKVSAVFVPCVIGIAIMTAVVWYWLGQSETASYILVTSMSVLIIACPCALGLATPISTMIGIGKAAEYGGLIRNGDALQRASELTMIVLDKTGTITTGKPTVVKHWLKDQSRQKEILNMVAGLEKGANHPLANALLAHCHIHIKKDGELFIEGFESLVGLGVQGKIEGVHYFLGNERLMAEKGIEIPFIGNAEFDRDPSVNTATKVYFADDSQLLATFDIKDPIKKGMKKAIDHFKQQGLQVVMLTGDNQNTAKHVAVELGIDQYQAQLLPVDKLNWIKKYQQKGEVVGMIGDGINDAPALTQADVGFAMGAGTDVAMESADVTLISNDLNSVANVIHISKATLKNIKQNLWGAFAYNSLGIPIAAGVLFPLTGWLLSPIIAGAAMSLSSVTVVTNANRLRSLSLSDSHNHST